MFLANPQIPPNEVYTKSSATHAVFCFTDEATAPFNHWYAYAIIHKREVFDEPKKIFSLLSKDEQ